MTRSAALTCSVAAPRPGRRLCAIALLSLTLLSAAGAPAALAQDPVMIQKPGHIAVQGL